MKVNAIIAEYNPFHNGHKYHLEASRLRTGADYTVIAMSGNYVQRGAPALLGKYERARMALLNGADLVLEIPTFYALGSAEFFAQGAVAMLDQLGVVNHLCFGSECGQEELLIQIASILMDEPEPFRQRLKYHLRKGSNFPTSRSLALLEYCPSLGEAMDIFTSPNNILGIEYIKALLGRSSSIQPSTIKRVGADYHERRMSQNQSSALALRHAILSHRALSDIRDQMPDSAYDILEQSLRQYAPVRPNDFSFALHYKLLAEMNQGYSQYMDVTEDISDRIRNNVYQFTNVKNFCELLKSKDVTYTRISRCLAHILLDMKKEAQERYLALDYVPYARVLGLKREASPLFSAIKEHSSIPLITKLADADKILSGTSLEMLREDIRISHYYNSLQASRARTTMQNEYSTPLVIL